MTSRATATAAAAMRAGALATLLVTARAEPNPHFADLLSKEPDMRAWDLQAKGIIDAAEEEAVQLEHELAQRLHVVLAEPQFATFFSVLGTPSFHGQVHTEQPEAPAVVESNTAPAPAAQQAAAPAVPIQVDPVQIEKLLAGLSPEQVAALAAMGQAVVQQGVVPVPAAPQDTHPQ